MRKHLFLISLFFLVQNVLAQSILKDTVVFNLLFEKAKSYNENNTDSAIIYIVRCLKFADNKKLSYKKVKGLSLYGHILENIGEVNIADSVYKKAIEISKFHNYYTLLSSNYLDVSILYKKKGEFKNALKYSYLALEFDSLYCLNERHGKIYQTLGSVYNSLSNYPIAFNYYFNAIKEFQKVNNIGGIGGSYCNIANIYDTQTDYTNAIKNYKIALVYLNKTTNDYFKIITTTNLGVAYGHKKLHDSAIRYYNIALIKANEIKNISLIGNINQNMAVSYLDQKKLTKAEEFLLKSQSISEKTEDSASLANVKILLGACYLGSNKINKSIKYYQNGYLISKNIGSNELIITSLYGLFDAYYANKQFKEAANSLKKYVDLKDSVFNIDNSNVLSELKTNFEVEKKETQLKAEQQKKDLKTNEEKQKQKIILTAVCCGLLLVLAFTVFVFRSLRIAKKQKHIIELKEQETQEQNVIIKEQKHLVEEKHKEITDSINYAERIQRSFLASEKLLDENLKNYFIFFKPKDVVSGDFYCGSKITFDKFLLVTADSTGHGVPGAIMSLLNITSLEKAIEQSNNPAEILNLTRQTIISRLKNDGSETGGKDGMDCTVLSIDFKNNILNCAASNNPIWIIRNNELIEIKPDKMPVGKHDRDSEPFTLHTLPIHKNDVIYTLTDGFPDQFGGEKGKKFMTKNLKELLLKNVHLPMSQQKQLLETTFINWIGNLEQIDDVTVIGIKI